VLKGS